jgi:histone-lysine N-methyltransferase SETMAR
MTSTIAKIRDRAIVEFCFKIGFSTATWLELLHELYGKEAPSKNTISAYYFALEAGSFSYIDPSPTGRKTNEELILHVEDEIRKNPFLSLRKLAELVDSNKDSVRDILIYKLGLKKRYLRWIPHSLSDSQKRARVSVAAEMLEVLRKAEKSNFKNVITGDERWILYDYPYDSFWGKKDDPPTTAPKVTVESSKLMVVVFWGVDDVPVIKFLERGKTMTAALFQEVVIKPLSEIASSLPKEEKMLVHWDNASSHRAASSRDMVKESILTLLPQPAYSPDVSPSDFFLFGYLKSQLKGKKCKTAAELEERVSSIVKGIPRDMKLHVFHDWMWRLQAIISSGGEYH